MTSSSLDKRQCVAWRTDRPFVKRLRFSPDFAYQNSYWHLCLGFTEENEYYIQLERKSTRNRFESFDATVYIESIAEKEIFFPRTVTISRTPQRIWNTPESEILEKIPSLELCGEFSVICVLHKICGMTSFFTREETAKHLYIRTPAFVSQISQPDLENLSIDMCKMLENETFPDIKLRCGDRTFSAHRFVLSARSEVFATMFRNNVVESEAGTVDITDVKAPIFDLFLKCAYSGKVSMSWDTVPSLYAASDKFAFHFLKKVCSEWMLRGLTEENCLDCLILADAHNDLLFEESVISFISNSIGSLRSEDWKTFSKKAPNLAVKVYCNYFAKQSLKNAKKNESLPSGTVANQQSRLIGRAKRNAVTISPKFALSTTID